MIHSSQNCFEHKIVGKRIYYSTQLRAVNFSSAIFSIEQRSNKKAEQHNLQYQKFPTKHKLSNCKVPSRMTDLYINSHRTMSMLTEQYS